MSVSGTIKAFWVAANQTEPAEWLRVAFTLIAFKRLVLRCIACPHHNVQYFQDEALDFITKLLCNIISGRCNSSQPIQSAEQRDLCRLLDNYIILCVHKPTRKRELPRMTDAEFSQFHTHMKSHPIYLQIRNGEYIQDQYNSTLPD